MALCSTTVSTGEERNLLHSFNVEVLLDFNLIKEQKKKMIVKKLNAVLPLQGRSISIKRELGRKVEYNYFFRSVFMVLPTR